jgi:hypothetical protein
VLKAEGFEPKNPDGEDKGQRTLEPMNIESIPSKLAGSLFDPSNGNATRDQKLKSGILNNQKGTSKEQGSTKLISKSL